jgi:hypothetical protein
LSPIRKRLNEEVKSFEESVEFELTRVAQNNSKTALNEKVKLLKAKVQNVNDSDLKGTIESEIKELERVSKAQSINPEITLELLHKLVAQIDKMIP